MSKAGRKKVEGGVRRMWTVPPDIDAAVKQRGTKWLWHISRVVLAYESAMVVDANNEEEVLVGK